MSPRIDYDVPCSLSVAGSSSDSASLPCYFLKPKCVSVRQAIVRSFLSLCRFLIAAIKADGASSSSHPHSLSPCVRHILIPNSERVTPKSEESAEVAKVVKSSADLARRRSNKFEVLDVICVCPSTVFKPPKKVYLHRAEVVESRFHSPRSWEGEVNVFGFQRLAIRHLFFAAVRRPSVKHNTPNTPFTAKRFPKAQKLK